MSQQTLLPFVRDVFRGLSADALSDAESECVIRLALAVLKKRYRRGAPMDNPQAFRDYLRLRLREYKAEIFGVVFLDNRHHVLADVELFQGTIDGASVYPRVVVQQALEHNAAALILYHNHPSGVAEPSSSDEQITRRLKEALALVDIRVLDHFVVGIGESVSFAESGLL